MAVGAALIAGTVAASVAYLLYMRPQWRRYVVEIGRHLLTVAEGISNRKPSLEDTVRDELGSVRSPNPQIAEAFREAIGED